MADLGLYHYGARFYDPKLARFISADTIVPGAGNPQNLNRYAYVNNNPLKFTDPTGHETDCGPMGNDPCPGDPPSPPPTPFTPWEMPAPATVSTPPAQESSPSHQAGPSVVDYWRFVKQFIPGIELDNGIIYTWPLSGDVFTDYDVSIQVSSCSTLNPSPSGKLGPIFVGIPRAEVNAGNLDSVYVTAQVYDPLALRGDVRKRMQIIPGITLRPEATFLTQPSAIAWQNSVAEGATLIIGNSDAAREFSLRLILTRRDYPPKVVAGTLVALAVSAPEALPFLILKLGDLVSKVPAGPFEPAFGQ